MASYREFTPPSELRGLLECCWRSSVGLDEPPHEQRVLLDGCMDLIWSIDQVFVAGPDTTAFTSAQLPGQLGVGLRFRPGAAPTLLGLPAHELRDRRVALTEVHPGLAARVEALSRNGQDPAHALVGAVRERLPELEPPSAVHRAATLLTAGAGVSATAERLGWSARTLHRRSLDAFGYGPSTLRRCCASAVHSGWHGAVCPSPRSLPAAGTPTRPTWPVRCGRWPVPRWVDCWRAQPDSGANRSMLVPSGSSTPA